MLADPGVHPTEHTASLVAKASGDYRLIVQPTQKRASAGGYQIRIEEMRAATENDRALYETHLLFQESIKLRDAGRYDEALPLFERVIETRKRILGPDAPELAAAIHDLAVSYYYKAITRGLSRCRTGRWRFRRKRWGGIILRSAPLSTC